MIYDFLIIGSGVVGSAIARELSRLDASICVLEKNSDVCFETSGRNSGVVHAGFSYDTGSLKNILCLKGNVNFDTYARELDFPFKRCGKLLVGNNLEDLESLKKTYDQGLRNGVKKMSLVDEGKIQELVNGAIGRYGIFSENSGIVDPFLFNISLAENAASNGVDFFFNEKVISIEKSYDLFIVKTPSKKYKTKFLINAAGLFAAEISKMLGIDEYKVIYSKGEYIILNKDYGKFLPMPLYPVPSNTYMGIHLTNTTDGNVLVGPNAEITFDNTDYSVTSSGVYELEKSANRIWPFVKRDGYIRTYSGILPKWVDDKGIIQDFKIEILDNKVKNFINLIGIESPGLTCAIPIGEYVRNLILEREYFKENKNFNPYRNGIKKFSQMTFDEKNKAINNDKDYGEIICRCENVTKSEIIEAIKNPLGVYTMKSIKYRTRAMTGLCQGGYCQMRIAKLIENELNINYKDITYSTKDNNLFFGRLRDV